MLVYFRNLFAHAHSMLIKKRIISKNMGRAEVH